MDVGIDPNLGPERPGALPAPEPQPAGDQGVDLLEHVGAALLGDESVGEHRLAAAAARSTSNAAGSAENSSGTSSRSRSDRAASARVFDAPARRLRLVERADLAHSAARPATARARPGSNRSTNATRATASVEHQHDRPDRLVDEEGQRQEGRNQEGDAQRPARPDHLHRRGTSTDRMSSVSRYVGGPSLDLGLGRKHDAMPQGGQDDVLHVVGQDVVAPLEGRDGPRPAQDRHAGARRGAQRKRRPLPGLPHQARDVSQHVVVDQHARGPPLHLAHLGGARHRHRAARPRRGPSPNPRVCSLRMSVSSAALGIFDHQLEQEAVELGLRQGCTSPPIRSGSGWPSPETAARSGSSRRRS